MLVTVKLFAWLQDAAETDVCRVTLEPGARGADAKAAVAARYPRLRGLLDPTRLARNLDYQPWNCPLLDGDELCFIPPVSGG